MDEHSTVMVAGFEPARAKHILALFHDDESVQVVGLLENPAEAVQYAISTIPDVIIVSGEDPAVWHEICSFIDLAVPRSCVILVVQQADPETLSNAMMLGVRRVLTYDSLADTIVPAISRIQELEQMRSSAAYLSTTDPMKHPRLISLSGAKGGVGKTTLSVNLGVALAHLDAGSVVVWDAYKQFGDVASVMGITPARTLSELVEVADDSDVDDDLILGCTVRHSSGAHVLITSDRPMPPEVISGEWLFDRIVMALRKRYRFIVVDTPPMLSPSDTLIFARSWRLLLVTNLKDVTAISDTSKLIDILAPHYVRDEVISIVLNRTSRGDSAKDTEVEELTGKRVIATIPEDPQVAQANNLGRPICQTNPHSNAVKAINKLADSIAQSASTFQTCL